MLEYLNYCIFIYLATVWYQLNLIVFIPFYHLLSPDTNTLLRFKEMSHSIWSVMFFTFQQGEKLNLFSVKVNSKQRVKKNNLICFLVDLCTFFVFIGKTSKKLRRIGKKEQRHCKWNIKNYFHLPWGMLFS